MLTLFASYVQDQIIGLAADDPLKQLQLAAAVCKRMQGIKPKIEHDQEAWCYVRNSLKAFFAKLQDKYKGRYPNDIRAVQQGVCAAIANACPRNKLGVISDELGISIEQLSKGRKHWSEWVSGDRESLVDLRGKIRSDGMDEAWIEFALDVWTSSTRRSERAKDSLRNPNDKSDKKLYRVHWLEMRIGDIHVRAVPPAPHTLSRSHTMSTLRRTRSCAMALASSTSLQSTVFRPTLSATSGCRRSSL